MDPSRYEIDPYGAAISDIVKALEEAFKYHGGMNDVEFVNLVIVARCLKAADPAVALGVPVMKVKQ